MSTREVWRWYLVRYLCYFGLLEVGLSLSLFLCIIFFFFFLPFLSISLFLSSTSSSPFPSLTTPLPHPLPYPFPSTSLPFPSSRIYLRIKKIYILCIFWSAVTDGRERKSPSIDYLKEDRYDITCPWKSSLVIEYEDGDAAVSHCMKWRVEW